MKTAYILLTIFCIGFCAYAEWQVYQHYLVINRDYYPVMSEFYKMYAERLGHCVQQCAALTMGYRASRMARTLAS